MMYISNADMLLISADDCEKYGIEAAFNMWVHNRVKDVKVIDIAGAKHVNYDHIPARSKAKLPTREVLIAMTKISTEDKREQDITSLKAAIETAMTKDYLDYVPYYYGITMVESRAISLAKACAVLRVGASINFRTSKITIQDYMMVVNELGLKELKFGRRVNGEWVNMNPQVAYRKIREAKEAGDPKDVVRMKRAGNDNARKVSQTVEMVVKYIYCYMGNGMLLPPGVWERYNQWVEMGGAVDYNTGEAIQLPTLSLSTVKSIIHQPAVQMMSDRIKFGDRIFNNQYVPYVMGKRPEYMLSVVGMDDEDAPFYLNIKNNLYKRAKVVFVFDGSSRKIVGYAIGMGASHTLYREAIQSMLRGDIESETKGVIPGEVQLDHYTKGDKSEWEKYFQVVNFGRAKNPQERYAEREIYQWESRYMREVPGWLGLGIKTKRYQNKRNEDANIIRYTLEEIDEIYRKYIPIYNREIGTEKEVNPSLHRLNPHVLAQYAGNSTRVNINRGYVGVGIEGEKYWFTVPSYESVLTKLDNRFNVRLAWIGDEPEQVHIFNWRDKEDVLHDEYLCTAQRTYNVQRAWIEQGDEDKKELGKALTRRQKILQMVADMEKELKSHDFSPMTLAEAEAVVSSGTLHKPTLMQAEEVLLSGEEEEYDPTKFINPRYK